MSVLWLTHCESTQDELWRASHEVTAVATDHQTSGRGRHGRVWLSEPGQSLALSWRVPTVDLDVKMLPLLSLAAGVAVYRWLCRFSQSQHTDELVLKWPNDILFQQRKLAGILCEGRLMTRQSVARQKVVIGVGINLFSAPQLIPRPAYLSEMCDRQITLEEVKDQLSILVEELLHCVMLLRDHPAQLLEVWRASAFQLGTPLKAGLKQGLYAGINERGALLLDIDGALCTVETGEVHLISHLPHLSGEF